MQMTTESTHELTLNETEAIMIADEINHLVLYKQIRKEDYLFKLGQEMRRNLDLHNAGMQLHVDSFSKLE